MPPPMGKHAGSSQATHLRSQLPVPGIAGEASAEDGVHHGQGYVVFMEGTADQLLRERVRGVSDG